METLKNMESLENDKNLNVSESLERKKMIWPWIARCDQIKGFVYLVKEPELNPIINSEKQEANIYKYMYLYKYI